MGATTAQAKAIEAELKKVDRSIEQYLDRVADANSQTLITAYENRIRSLEEKALLREKAANCGQPLKDFDQTFRAALAFLANPCNP